MRREKKEKQMQETLERMRREITDKIFATEYATFRVIAINLSGEIFYIKWEDHQNTPMALVIHDFRQWVSTTFGINYYGIELEKSITIQMPHQNNE